MMNKFVLLLECKDRPGIVAKISDFIYRNRGNIITADQHTTHPEGGYFFMRVEFAATADKGSLTRVFKPTAARLRARWQLNDPADKLRMGILVSQPGHCLAELLYLWSIKELPVEIPLIISNDPAHRRLVEQYGIPFCFIPAAKKDRRESQILAQVKNKTDFLVLARYMLVLSRGFLNKYAKDIINIHHGFLPSFKGGHPYRQALERGVKVIGATAHFVNEKLDDGPIIAQSVAPVSHRDSLGSLVRRGRNLEKTALSEALHQYLDYRIIRHQNKTIVF